jgi:hypothetical protein
MTFFQWMKKVNDVLLDKIGFTSSCLCDVDYRSMWSNGYTPVEAAQEALNAEWGSRAPNIMELYSRS